MSLHEDLTKEGLNPLRMLTATLSELEPEARADALIKLLELMYRYTPSDEALDPSKDTSLNDFLTKLDKSQCK